MKANHPLLAAMLSGAFVVAVESGAGAQDHHRRGDNGAQGSTAFVTGEKSGDTFDHGDAKNQNSGAPDANTGDKVGQQSGALDGPMKKGDAPGKTGSPNAGSSSADSGKANSGDKGWDNGHTSKNAGDTGKPDNIVADGPGHKIKKPEDKSKKLTTIFRPHANKDHPHPSTTATSTLRNAIGVALHDTKEPQKPAFDVKTGNKVANLPVGPSVALGVSSGTKTVTSPTTPTTVHTGSTSEVAPRSGAAISGSGVGRPGTNLASIGGPNNTMVGVLSGSSFKPKHP
jgi:hypothetical protein